MTTDARPGPARKPGAEPRGRIAAVDALRGLALFGMVLYHLLWDLHAFGLLALDPSGVAPIRWLGHAVAAAFLVLSGLSLRLAERAGQSRRAAMARLATLALAAGGVTLATWIAVPEAAIRFGILHCLVVSNAIGLAIRGCSNRSLVMVAAGCVVLPMVWFSPLPPAWSWLGLSAQVSPTLDFRPVLPWLAGVLLGLAAGRTAFVSWLAQWRLHNRISVWTMAGGRHSLAIYLLHQPVLVGAVVASAVISGASPDMARLSAPTEAAAFLAECARSCENVGGEADLCRSTCHCVLTAAVRPTSGRGWLDRLRPPDAAIGHAVKACRPASTPGG